MKRLLRTVVATLLLVAVLAPASYAADDAAAPVADATATPEPAATPVENGEIVIDPTFIIASPTPVGAVRGETGRPDVTPPATDSVPAATTSGTRLHVLLVLGVAGLFLALVVGRPPATRRR